MSYNVHGAAEIGKILMWVAGFAAFVVVAPTKVPERISPGGASIAGGKSLTLAPRLHTASGPSGILGWLADGTRAAWP